MRYAFPVSLKSRFFSFFVSFFLGAAFFGAAVTVFKYCSSFGLNFGSHLFQMRADIY